MNKVGDLVSYRDAGALYLARITNIDTNNWMDVTDEYILFNPSNYRLSWAGIMPDEVVENYGNITLDEFKEKYPEYFI